MIRTIASHSALSTELAAILARGYLRLVESSRDSGANREGESPIQLDSPPLESPPVGEERPVP